MRRGPVEGGAVGIVDTIVSLLVLAGARLQGCYNRYAIKRLEIV